MIITIDAAPLDEGGELVHAEDAVAQLCLALVRLEAELADHGLGMAAVDRLRVLTIEPADPELVDLVLERCYADGATPPIACLQVARLEVPGMLVGVSADVATLI